MSKLCGRCSKGDHTAHRQNLAGICVGCVCPWIFDFLEARVEAGQIARREEQRVTLAEIVVCPTPRKPRYHSEEVALDHLASHDPDDQPRLRPYLCQCDSWHLTSINVFLLRAAGDNRRGGERRWSVVALNDGTAVLSISTASPRSRRVKRLRLELDRDSAAELADALLAATSVDLEEESK